MGKELATGTQSQSLDPYYDDGNDDDNYNAGTIIVKIDTWINTAALLTAWLGLISLIIHFMCPAHDSRQHARATLQRICNLFAVFVILTVFSIFLRFMASPALKTDKGSNVEL